MILQYVAPLVHAHTGGDKDQIGLHLYEFETLQLTFTDKLMSSIDSVPDRDSCIVNIGSAIKQPFKGCYLDNVLSVAFVSVNLPPAFSKLVNFSAFSDEFVPLATVSQHHSRAPPCLI